MRTRPIPVLLLLATLLGCAGSDRTAVDGGSLPHWRLALQLRIGSLDDPDQGLTRVTQVAFGPDERIYIAQSVDRQVRVYDTAGNLLHRIGRDGEGPGEFRSISAIGFLHDTLTVSDGSLRRLNLFTAEGDFIDSFPWSSKTDGEMKPPVFYMPAVPQVVLDDGTGLLQENFGFMPGSVESIEVPWLRIDREGTRQDTIALQVYEMPSGRPTLKVAGQEIPVSPPITDAPLFQLSADRTGLAIVERRIAANAEPDTFRLIRIGPDGDTTLTRSYGYSPVPTPPGEADRQVDRYVDIYSVLPNPPTREDLSRILHRPDFLPAFLPPVSAIRTGQDGWIWIQREATPTDTIAWDAIDAAGDMAGEIALPKGARIMAAMGDLLAVLEQDEYDVPWVLVYRIERE